MNYEKWKNQFVKEFAKRLSISEAEFQANYIAELDNWIEDEGWQDTSPKEAVSENLSNWGD